MPSFHDLGLSSYEQKVYVALLDLREQGLGGGIADADALDVDAADRLGAEDVGGGRGGAALRRRIVETAGQG
ncbi:MAG: hypothetical protein IH933_17280, partial [Euryarchaeota archaeon]|nr:hypothetical protein [Euryarchaeota archaeon]